jgi:ABC-2 type transport system ATP-binding protein
VSLQVRRGELFALLGTNGAGKTTTIEVLEGLQPPSAGRVRVLGLDPVRDRSAVRPRTGVMLQDGGFTGSLSVRETVEIWRSLTARPRPTDEVVELVGLGRAARRRIKGYSLGMRQRLGIAAALLADPRVLLFDEPVNGLDLDGVRWIRGLLRRLADEGRTVLVSSHLLSEMQQTADRLVVIGRGRLIADATTDEILRGLGDLQVSVRSSRSDELLAGLRDHGFTAARVDADELRIEDASAFDVGRLANSLHLPLHHLSEVAQSLEDAYLALTGSSVQFHGREAAPEMTTEAAQ